MKGRHEDRLWKWGAVQEPWNRGSGWRTRWREESRPERVDRQGARQWRDSRQTASMLASTVVTNITCTWRTADSLCGERQPRAVLRAIIILLLCGYNIIVILLIAAPESLCRPGPLLFAPCSAPPPPKATR